MSRTSRFTATALAAAITAGVGVALWLHMQLKFTFADNQECGAPEGGHAV